MNKHDTKSEIEDKAFIRIFRENSSGAIFRFPVIGFLPYNIQTTTAWFIKVLRPSLYEVSSLIPVQTDDGIPRIEIDAFMLPYTTEDPEPKSGTIVILPYGVDGTDWCTGVDEEGLLVQIKTSNLFNKNLYTEVHDSPEDPSINCTSKLKNDLTKFMNIKDESPSEEDRNAIVFCEDNKLKTLQTIDKTLENEGFLHVDWPFYAKDAVTQINIAFISEPKLYVRNVVSEKQLARDYVKYYVVGELRQKLSADGRKHKIIVYPIYRNAGSLSSVFTLIPNKYAYLHNGNTDEDDVLYDTYIKEV